MHFVRSWRIILGDESSKQVCRAALARCGMWNTVTQGIIYVTLNHESFSFSSFSLFFSLVFSIDGNPQLWSISISILCRAVTLTVRNRKLLPNAVRHRTSPCKRKRLRVYKVLY